MDNFGVKFFHQKNVLVENDCFTSQNVLKKKLFLDDKKKWITNDFDTIKQQYGCYYCCYCEFDTKNLKDFKRHLNTKKHQKKTPKKTPNFETDSNERYECVCGKDYKFASGLSKHKAKCKIFKNTQKKVAKMAKNGKNGDKNHPQNTIFGKFKAKNQKTKKKVLMLTKQNQQNENNTTCGLDISQLNDKQISEIVKQSLNQTETINKLLEQNTVLIEKLSSTSTNNITYQNCGNKKMTINVYLNEQCKHAMNLSDFVNNLTISLDDLLYTKQHGYMNGISNIFVKKLTDLNPNERPIHCSDKKRLQFYVRDENKWLKDNGNKKIDKSIQDLTIKQIKQLREWEQKNPNYSQDEKLLAEWQDLVHKIMGPSTDTEREKEKELIMKKIGTTTEIKDNLIILDKKD